MSPLRTFYRQLYLNIKLEDHKNAQGKFLDTLYDAGMQYPLLEMAGFNRVMYFAELTYFYNTNYGNNDDSSRKKIKHRQKMH